MDLSKKGGGPKPLTLGGRRTGKEKSTRGGEMSTFFINDDRGKPLSSKS